MRDRFGPLSGWRIRVLAALGLLIVLGAAGVFGYQLWYNSANFVSTILVSADLRNPVLDRLIAFIKGVS